MSCSLIGIEDILLTKDIDIVSGIFSAISFEIIIIKIAYLRIDDALLFLISKGIFIYFFLNEYS